MNGDPSEGNNSMTFERLKTIKEGSDFAVAIEGGKMLLLEQRAGARVYLGALLDGLDQVREWLEIWTQTTSGLADDELANQQGLTNPLFDRRWEEMAAMQSASAASSVWRGDWECFAIAPQVVSGRPLLEGHWRLCEDETLLKKKRLTSYVQTAHRYLMNEEETCFVRLSENSAQAGGATPSREEAFGESEVFNEEGGRIMIRQLPTMTLTEIADLLRGDGDVSVRSGLDEKLAMQGSQLRQGSLFLVGGESAAERAAEVFYLKLSLLAGVTGQIRATAAATKLPLGGVATEAFGVRLSTTCEALPALWTQQVIPGWLSQYVGISLGPSDDKFPASGQEIAGSIYRPPRLVGLSGGMARVRLSSFGEPDSDGLVVLKGSLESSAALERASRRDVLRLIVRDEDHDLTVYATINGHAQGSSEWSFVSYAMKVPEAMRERYAEGGLLAKRVEFELFRRPSPGADLYGLGMVALRVLLARSSDELEELRELVREINQAVATSMNEGAWDTGGGDLGTLLEGEKGTKWLPHLNSEQLMDGLSESDASAGLPRKMWWEVISWICRLFPEEMPGAFLESYDDYDTRAPELVFDQALAEIESLAQRAKQMVVGNPLANREILEVIRSVATGK